MEDVKQGSDTIESDFRKDSGSNVSDAKELPSGETTEEVVAVVQVEVSHHENYLC